MHGDERGMALVLTLMLGKALPKGAADSAAHALAAVACGYCLVMGLLALRRPDKRAIWDRAARTLVRYRRPRLPR